MILSSPEWSLTSVQFTHGFPRKLVEARHGGFLPGNVIVTAAATNHCLRRLAVCDVASLISKCSVAGVGLSYARLVNLRYAAIRYRRGSYLPNYLVRGMLEAGVNFATFEALEVETLEELQNSLKNSWNLRRDEDDESDPEWDGMLSNTLSPAVIKRIGQIGPSDDDSMDEQQQQSALTNLLCHAVTREFGRLSEEDTEGEEAADGGVTPNTGSNKQKRRRPSSGWRSSSSGRRKTSNQSSSASTEQAPTEAQPLSSLLARSLSSSQGSDPFGLDGLPFPGFKKDAFPSGASKTSLFQFLEKHRPLARTVSHFAMKYPHLEKPS